MPLRGVFYFVEGTLNNDPTLDRYEQEKDYTFTKKQREFYVSKPGAAQIMKTIKLSLFLAGCFLFLGNTAFTQFS